LAGDHEGYYQDFSDSVVDLARVIEKGWLYCGEYSHYWKAPRGTDTTGLPRTAFTICIQNHDQVGNRALGERLHHEVDLAVWRAASVLFLHVPAIPLLFMGQEWAASTPFLFFTDHNPELGAQVTEGRREEFKHYAAFTDPHRREKIPDPQAESTFLASKLLWEEKDRPPHAGILRLYRELLRQRRLFSPLSDLGKGAGGEWFRAIPLEENGVLVVLSPSRVVVCWLKGAGTVELADHLADMSSGSWQVLLSTEDPAWCEDARPIRVDCFFGLPATVTFRRPGAIVLQRV
jgi:maltooligosyltrehalose trehalohydrolase